MSSLLAQVLKGGDRTPRRRTSDASSAHSPQQSSLGAANAARLEWLCQQTDALEARVDGPRCAATEKYFVAPGLTPQQAVSAIRQSCARTEIPLPCDAELHDMAFDLSLAGNSGMLEEGPYGDFLLMAYRHSLATLAEELSRDWIARLNAEEPNAATLSELHRLLHGGSGTRSARRSRQACA
jgi:hypothetical protein